MHAHNVVGGGVTDLCCNVAQREVADNVLITKAHYFISGV